MSNPNENDVFYETIIAEEVEGNSCILSDDKSSDFMYIQCDDGNDERMDKEKEPESDKNDIKIDMSEHFIRIGRGEEETFPEVVINDIEEAAALSFDEEQDIKHEQIKTECTDVEIASPKNPEVEKPEVEKPDFEKPDFEEPDFEKPDFEKPDFEKPDFEKPEVEKPETENESEKTEEDIEGEDTIATFVTAAGKQLALYGVENSEDIFAAALYEESGDPPSNFQFLMRDDVQRLIGEGAVRTVKKPAQIKRQLVTTQAPVVIKRHVVKVPAQEPKPRQTIWNYTKSYERKKKSAPVQHHVVYSASSSGHNTFVQSVPELFAPEPTLTLEEEIEEEELLVSSVLVHDLLVDKPDSDLTHDDIRVILNMEKLKGTKNDSKMDLFEDSVLDESVPEPANGLNISKKSLMPKMFTKSTPQIFRKQASTNRQPKEKICESRTLFLDDATDYHIEAYEDLVENAATPAAKKEKRPRKQKLTTVNRGDSEIIIQHSALLEPEEEETPVKKRGRRKRKSLPDPDYNPRTPTKKIGKMRKHSRVEVINIDGEEDENATEVMVITLEDGKEKSSSDKENNVVDVGDSDEEEEEEEEEEEGSDDEEEALTCDFCSRIFRENAALERHIKNCTKSPANVKKARKKPQKSSNSNVSVKKEFPCKTCGEKFDAPLAVARHVRLTHSQRKSKFQKRESTPEEESDADEEDKEEEEKNKKKRKKDEKEKKAGSENESNDLEKNESSNGSDEEGKSKTKKSKPKKCEFCIKMFVDAKSLDLHVQTYHTEKKDSTGQDCEICKKNFKNEALLRRHMRVHRETMEVESSEENKAENVPCPEESESLSGSPRKRGRPRKNKSDV